MPRNNTHITADQCSTLVDEASITTHHGEGTGDTDRRAMDTKRGDPPAYTIDAEFSPRRGRLRKTGCRIG